MARRIAKDAGIRYVYTGNIYDPAGQATYCHSCGAILIGRDGYVITAWNLSAEGSCAECGTSCHGVLPSRPGELRPEPLTDSGRDTLASSGSCHQAKAADFRRELELLLSPVDSLPTLVTRPLC